MCHFESSHRKLFCARRADIELLSIVSDEEYQRAAVNEYEKSGKILTNYNFVCWIGGVRTCTLSIEPNNVDRMK